MGNRVSLRLGDPYVDMINPHKAHGRPKTTQATAEGSPRAPKRAKAPAQDDPEGERRIVDAARDRRTPLGNRHGKSPMTARVSQGSLENFDDGFFSHVFVGAVE